MKQKKGFTLVELLAVLIVLSIILAITIPAITAIFRRAKINAFASDANMVLKAINIHQQKDSNFDQTNLNEDNVKSILDTSNKNYKSLSVIKNEEGKPQITIVGKNKWNCLVAEGTLSDITVTEICEDGGGGIGEIPVITMLGDDPVYVVIGEEYIDAGATAYDEEDGDITGNIMVESTVNVNEIGIYSVLYRVKDSDGNYAISKVRTVYVVDGNIPVITLLGLNPTMIVVGEEYVDAGATAWDEEDGNITENIIVESTVNPNTVGSYTVTYTVTDSSGNPAVPVTRIVHVVSSEYITSKGVNRPKLVLGMTAVKWNGSTWEEITDPINDTSWYNYTTDDKQWANVRNADGSMWVWIPRFVYKITSNWHNNATGTIEIQFSMGIDDTRDGTISIVNTGNAEDSNGNWTNHPAFKFGDKEITGFWVAKFEPSNNSGNVKIIPGVASWRDIKVNNIFTNCRNMETNPIYGWGTSGTGIDTHMMKNVEWGAVAYLAKSNYGKETEITMNSNTSYYTGGGSGNAYVTNVGQSSTGNIYGIYDLAGGANEYVAAYLNNGHDRLTGNGSSLYYADEKYKDVYIVDPSDSDLYNYNNTAYRKGDAMWETSKLNTGTNSWFGDTSIMLYANSPFMGRGGYCHSYSTNAGAFAFNRSDGTASGNSSFRPVIIIASGL